MPKVTYRFDTNDPDDMVSLETFRKAQDYENALFKICHNIKKI